MQRDRLPQSFPMVSRFPVTSIQVDFTLSGRCDIMQGTQIFTYLTLEYRELNHNIYLQVCARETPNPLQVNEFAQAKVTLPRSSDSYTWR